MIHDDRSAVGSTVQPVVGAGASRQPRADICPSAIRAALAPGGHMPHPRLVMSLEDYLDAGRREHRACFACRKVALPLPLSMSGESGRQERRCGICGESAAVALPQAASEGWLDVVDATGRTVSKLPALVSR